MAVYARHNGLPALRNFGKMQDFQISSRTDHSALYILLTLHLHLLTHFSLESSCLFHSTDLLKRDFHGRLCGSDAFLQGLRIRRNKQEKQICGKTQYLIVWRQSSNGSVFTQKTLPPNPLLKTVYSLVKSVVCNRLLRGSFGLNKWQIRR
jgi:hypothetical protein